MSLKRVVYSECLDSISSIKNGVIYYVSYGRNAWHSTWVSLYREGAFHHSLKSAQLYCEKHRVQGSVFDIDELPAVVIKSKNRISYITEINVRCPLLNYVAKPNLLNHEDISGKSTVAEVKNSFLPSSDHWKIRPRADNSVIILSDELKSNEPILPGDITNRKAYTSYVREPHEFLGWKERKSEILSEGIFKSIIELGVKRKKRKKNNKIKTQKIIKPKIEDQKSKKDKFLNFILLAMKDLGIGESQWVLLDDIIHSIKK